MVQHFTKICDVSVEGLRRELAAHPELWNQYTVRRDAPKSPHSGMADIWVRYNDVAPFEVSGDYRRFNDEHVPIWYPAYDALTAIRPIVGELLRQVPAEMLGGVLITKIPPGGGIERHTDHGWHVDYYEKFYVTVQNAPGCVFGADADGVQELLTPERGEVWLFDNHKPHWVTNDSDQDRITLIVCLRRLK